MSDKLYTVAQLGEIFDVTRQTIYNWHKDGRFPNAITVGDKNTILIPASDVEKVKKDEADKLRARLRRLGFLAIPA